MKFLSALGQLNPSSQSAAAVPTEHPPEKVIAPPPRAVLATPLQERLKTPEASFKVPNFISRGRSVPGAPLPLRHLRTQEELALANRLESNLQSYAGTDFANRLLHYFSNSSLTSPEIFAQLREEIPLYASVIAAPNSSNLIFRGMGATPDLIEQIRESGLGPASRPFAHQLLHGFKHADGSYRLGTGVTSATTLEKFARTMIDLRVKGKTDKVPLLLNISVAGDRPGNGYLGARGVAFKTNALPDIMDAISEHELILDLTNRYELQAIEPLGNGGLLVHVHAYGRKAPVKTDPVPTDRWPQVGDRMGSNAGGRFVDGKGVHWYVKVPTHDDIAKNEYVAAGLYQAAGVRVPNVALVTRGGQLATASQIVDNLRVDELALRAGRVAGVHVGFAADAWLANWDVVGAGYGNLMVDDSGNAIRIDTGGALLYRARGEPKGDAFDDQVTEMFSLLNAQTNPQAASVFGKMDLKTLSKGLKQVSQVSDRHIHNLCRSAPGGVDQQKALARRLIARRNRLEEELKQGLPHFHPAKNEQGLIVIIDQPTSSSASSEYKRAGATLTFSPQAKLPEQLNGVKLTSVKAPTQIADWTTVPTASRPIDEPPLPQAQRISTGAIIVEQDGRVWLCAPTNEFGGHALTFPKGTLAQTLSAQQNAVREAHENTGLSVNLTGFIGDFTRGSGISRFYLAERINGTPADMGWKSQAVTLTTLEAAAGLLTHSGDHQVLKKLRHHLHPVADAKGHVVRIASPSKPGPAQALHDAGAIMSFVPGKAVAGTLNGVALASSAQPKRWSNAPGTRADFHEPEFRDIEGMARGTGVFILEDDGRAWLAEPTNHYGGQAHTFSKSGVDARLSLRENAVMQVRQKTGLQVELISHLGDFERKTTYTRYYIGKRTGGTPADMGWENQSLQLVPLGALKTLLTSPADQRILDSTRRHVHPDRDERGKLVIICNPATPSPDRSWNVADAPLTFTPHGPLPRRLNGIDLSAVHPPATWQGYVDAQVKQQPADSAAGASGVVIVEKDGRIWLVEPTNGYGGCRSTFPKGHQDPALTLGENAVKEAFEETGLLVKLNDFIGDFPRRSGMARFYLATRVGGSPHDMSWESQSVSLVTLAEARTRLNLDADQSLLQAVARHIHPQSKDDGTRLVIHEPTQPSEPYLWSNPDASLTFTPNGQIPRQLNEIAFGLWQAPSSLQGWQQLLPQGPDFEEPPFRSRPGAPSSSGAIIIEPDGRLWLVEPSNHFGGNAQTFPKGQQSDGLSLAQNALKETYEETGLRVQLKGVLGDYDRRGGRARFYIAVRTGGTPSAMGWESQSVRLLPLHAAGALLGPMDQAMLGKIESHIHPALDERGQHRLITSPTPEDPLGHRMSPNAELTFVPAGPVPSTLNGVAFKPVTLSEIRKAAPRDNPALIEPPFIALSDKPSSAGAIIVEADGRVWLTEPTNHFGGYRHSFPKGKVADGLTLQQTALKEVLEETGLHVRLLAFIDDVERGTSKARYYLAQRIGGSPAAMGWESQSVRLLTREKAYQRLNAPIDRQLLSRLDGFVHRLPDARGAAVLIHQPTTPTPPQDWADPLQVVSITSGGKLLGALNGVAFEPKNRTRNPDYWNKPINIAEPPFIPTSGKHSSSGVIIVESDGRIWLTEPTNHFGGYNQTFPKGRQEEGLTLAQNARKKAFELTGLVVTLTAFVGDVERNASRTRFYLATRAGGTPAQMDHKSQALKLAPAAEANALLNREVDQRLLSDVLRHVHPRRNDKNELAFIRNPATATDPSSWGDPRASLTFTPQTPVSGTLHNVPFSSWQAPSTLADWRRVDGTGSFSEPAFKPMSDKTNSSGVIIVEPDGRIWLTEPTNHFGNYQHSFPKGGQERGLSLRHNAIKEAYEETGLKVELTGFLGDYVRSTSQARYYLARRAAGTPQDMGWESQSVKLVLPEQAAALLNRTVDQRILADVQLLQRHPAARFDADLANRLQAQALGALARSKISVTGDGGVVQVDIRGDRTVFESVGMTHLHTAFPKALHYKAVDPSRFQANVVGGKTVTYPARNPAAQVIEDLFADTPLEQAKRHVLLNGSFYNIKRDFGLPEHAPVGSAIYPRGAPDCVEPYPEYSDQYVLIDLGDTHLHSGPLLSSAGQVRFTEDMLRQQRFRYGETSRSDPGMLYHANHPNPRSAVVLPSGIGHGENQYPVPRINGAHWDAIRLVSVTATRRGADSDGVTLPELAHVTRRLETLNATYSTLPPSRSINLDGGNSVYNAIVERDGKQEMPMPSGHQGAANFIALSQKPEADRGRFLRPAKKFPRP